MQYMIYMLALLEITLPFKIELLVGRGTILCFVIDTLSLRGRKGPWNCNSIYGH